MAPVMPLHNYKTWAIAAPPATHWRPASCKEIDCRDYLHGWDRVIDASTPLGLEAADWIRTQSGRAFTAERVGQGHVRFRFPAGQRCFAWRDHKRPLDRPELFLRMDGHHAAYDPGSRFQHTRPEDWRDEFGEHQMKLAAAIERG